MKLSNDAIQCPICGFEENKILHNVVFDKKHQIIKCLKCTNIFLSPRLTGGEIYGENYYYFNNYPAKAVKQDNLKSDFILNFIKQKFPQANSVFDVGAAAGIFLNKARKSGYKINGLEISKTGCKIAETVFGVKLYCGGIEDFFLNKKIEADIVVMTDVLEHSNNPESALKKIHSAMETGSRIIIETPNINSFYHKLIGKHWVGFNKYHNFYFSKDSLIKLSSDAGFKILLVFTTNFNLLSGEGLWRLGIKDCLKSALLKTRIIANKDSKKNFERDMDFNEISRRLNNDYETGFDLKKKISDWINFPLNFFFNKNLLGDQIWIILEK